jgi:Metallo-peptidase family M12B Reprolysin-like
MKYTIFFTRCILIITAFCVSTVLYGQQNEIHPNHPVCQTEVHDSGYYMKNAEAFLAARLAERQAEPNAPNFSSPYVVRVFIRIVRETNGTLPACDAATAIQNFNEMNDQYNGHNICFQLVGLDYINDSYLNNFNSDALLSDGTYENYIRNNNYDVDAAMTILIHYNYLNNNGSSGNAYGIPNNFVSIARWAVTSSSVHSIFGHEMGHDLGLYHTFSRNNDLQETVTRNVANSCYNCNVGGDLCCDTQADYRYTNNQSEDYVNNSCVYSRNYANPCDGLQYNPSTVNIMSYMPWSCISFTSTAITSNQRTRMHATINDILGPVYFRVAEDVVLLSAINASSNVVRIYGARTTVTSLTNTAITHSGSSKAYFAAGTAVIFTPGVTLAPGSGGLANASISGCN